MVAYEVPAWPFGPLLPKSICSTLIIMGVFSLKPETLLWKIIMHNNLLLKLQFNDWCITYWKGN